MSDLAQLLGREPEPGRQPLDCNRGVDFGGVPAETVAAIMRREGYQDGQPYWAPTSTCAYFRVACPAVSL